MPLLRSCLCTVKRGDKLIEKIRGKGIGGISSGKDSESVIEYVINIDGRDYRGKLIISHLTEEELERIRGEMENSIHDNRLTREELLKFFGPGSSIDRGVIKPVFLQSIQYAITEAARDSGISEKEIIKIRGRIGRELVDGSFCGTNLF